MSLLALFLIFGVFVFEGADGVGCKGQTCYAVGGKCVAGTKKCEFKSTNAALMKKIDPAYRFEENNLQCKKGMRSCTMTVCYLAWEGKCLMDIAGTCERTYNVPITPGSVAETDFQKHCLCEMAKSYCHLEAVKPAEKKN